MSKQDEKNSLLDKRSSRRKFLKNSGLTVGGLIVGGALGSLLGDNEAPKTEVQSEPQKTFDNPNVALMYFTPEQYRITEAATERIFPKDHNGPGAKELLVAYYIDHQLAGGWGTGTKEYTSGPFYPGESTQGYQGRLNRQQIFDIGLKAIQDHSVKTYENPFEKLSEEEQDAILTEFAEGKVELKGIILLTSSVFYVLQLLKEHIPTHYTEVMQVWKVGR